MELHDVRSHHGAGDLVDFEVVDQYGQIHGIKGRGLRNVNIYELIRENDDVRIWFEDPVTREVIWENWLVKTRAGRKKPGPYNLEQVEYLHKVAYPNTRLCVWEGDDEEGGYKTWREPLVTVTG
jgi:hypothetical protein